MSVIPIAVLRLILQYEHSATTMSSSSVTKLADAVDDDANSILAAAIGLTSLGVMNNSDCSSPDAKNKSKKNEAKNILSKAAVCDVLDHHRQKSTDTSSYSNTDIRILNFPKLIYSLLSEEDVYGSIISWLPDGKRFVIHDRHRFMAEILPTHFENCKYTSFTRRLKRWKFDRVSSGPDIGAYYNKNFIRDRPDFLSLLTYNMEDTDDDEEDGTKKEKVQVSKGAASSKPKPFSVREWQRNEKMKKVASRGIESNKAKVELTKLLQEPSDVNNTDPVLNTNMDKLRKLYQQKMGSRSDGQDVLLAPAVRDDIILSPPQDGGVNAINVDSTLPAPSLNILIQNHLLMMRQRQLGNKRLLQDDTSESIPPMEKKPKISSSFEEDYNNASLALKKIAGMHSAPSPNHSFTKKVSSGSELGHAVAARRFAMVDASVVDSALTNSLRRISQETVLLAVCQQDGISRHNLPVLNTPNTSQIKDPAAVNPDNRSYLKYQMFGSVSNFPFYEPTNGRSSINCNDSYSPSPSSSVLTSSLQRNISPHLMHMMNKARTHNNSEMMAPSRQHEADLILLDTKSMNELQQRIISQQEQNRQIRLRQRNQLFQMYHHQYQLAMFASPPPSKTTIKILAMLHDLKNIMLLDMTSASTATFDKQQQEFLDLLQLLMKSMSRTTACAA
jgi:hypothetical protein